MTAQNRSNTRSMLRNPTEMDTCSAAEEWRPKDVFPLWLTAELESLFERLTGKSPIAHAGLRLSAIDPGHIQRFWASTIHPKEVPALPSPWEQHVGGFSRGKSVWPLRLKEDSDPSVTAAALIRDSQHYPGDVVGGKLTTGNVASEAFKRPTLLFATRFWPSTVLRNATGTEHSTKASIITRVCFFPNMSLLSRRIWKKVPKRSELLAHIASELESVEQGLITRIKIDSTASQKEYDEEFDLLYRPVPSNVYQTAAMHQYGMALERRLNSPSFIEAVSDGDADLLQIHSRCVTMGQLVCSLKTGILPPDVDATSSRASEAQQIAVTGMGKLDSPSQSSWTLEGQSSYEEELENMREDRLTYLLDEYGIELP